MAGGTTKTPHFGQLLASFLGAIGGVLTALIGTGVLFPPSEWSPSVEKTGTASAHVTFAPVNFDREVLVQAEFTGNAGLDGLHAARSA